MHRCCRLALVWQYLLLFNTNKSHKNGTFAGTFYLITRWGFHIYGLKWSRKTRITTTHWPTKRSTSVQTRSKSNIRYKNIYSVSLGKLHFDLISYIFWPPNYTVGTSYTMFLFRGIYNSLLYVCLYIIYSISRILIFRFFINESTTVIRGLFV